MIFDDYDLMYKAYKDTSAGKRNQGNQLRYLFYLENNIYRLQYKLKNGLFQPAPLREKIVYYPKVRIVQVPSVEDKLVQHLICDNYAYTRLTNPLINETCACIKGRGSDYARNLLKEQLHRFYRKHHTMPYILKLDIHSYFASIPHKRLRELLYRYIGDKEIRDVMLSFLNLTEIGLPLGLQQSQLLANLYLSELDHLIKEKYRCKYYGRYMDDFYIISDNKAFLDYMFNEIKNYVESIGLELNPKSAIFYNKIEYLGFVFKLTDTGKVICKLSNSKKITQRHRLKLYAKGLQSNTMTVDYVSNSYQGWRNHALKGNTRNVVLAMDERFNKLLSNYGYGLKIEVVGGKEKVIIWQEQ